MGVQPKLAKGAKSIVEVSLAAWIDLLGYGSMLRKVQFDPTTPTAESAVDRLNRFQAHISAAASKYLPAVVINDGAVVCRDMSARSPSVTFDFIRRVVDLHAVINSDEHANGHPGARGVIAAGFRMRRRNYHKQSLFEGYGAHLIRKLENGSIASEEAIKSALMVRPFMSSIAEIQANFAFSKAYLADQAGSAAGFSDPKVYLDTAALTRPTIPWLKFSKVIEWAVPGMRGEFGAIQSLDVAAAGRCNHEGCRDAYQIACALSTSSDILERLRSLRIRNKSRGVTRSGH